MTGLGSIAVQADGGQVGRTVIVSGDDVINPGAVAPADVARVAVPLQHEAPKGRPVGWEPGTPGGSGVGGGSVGVAIGR